MTNLTMFNDQEVRLVGTPDVPEWVAADVISLLYPDSDKSNRRNYLEKVPVEWKGNKICPTKGGPQKMSTVYEPGLYYFICRSNSPLAVPFQKWIFEEVIPSIRKSGGHSKSSPSMTLKQINDSVKTVLSTSGKDAALIHYVDLLKEHAPGLLTDSLLKSAEQIHDMAQFAMECNSVCQWLSEAAVEGGSQSLSDLHGQYKSWCKEYDIAKPLGRTNFGKELRRGGATVILDKQSKKNHYFIKP